jgi:3-hydroxybutyryl-CoA dehydratase
MTKKTQHVELFQEGRSATFPKTISESDIYLLAGITGDFSPNHINEAFMKNTSYGKRIAHGALLVGFMSTASSLIIEKYPTDIIHATPVSLGYDRIRFVKPVFINDTITVCYTVEKIDHKSNRSYSKIEITNQHNEIVAAAIHILKWVANESL